MVNSYVAPFPFEINMHMRALFILDVYVHDYGSCVRMQLRKLTPLEFYTSELARLNKELKVAAVELEDFVAAQRLKTEVSWCNAMSWVQY